MTSPNPPAQQAGFPQNLDVLESNCLSPPWLYLLSALWRKLGGQYSTPQNMVYAQQTGTKQVTFYSVNTGVAIGHVTLT